MPCDIYLYDSINFFPLKEPSILIYPASSSHLGKNLGSSVNNKPFNINILGALSSPYGGLHSGKWGAALLFNTDKLVYTVSVHDPNGVWAPIHVTNLNGLEPGTLDIVMYKMPTGRSWTGRQPLNPMGVQRFVTNQKWTTEEQIGVMQLVQAIKVVRGTKNAILNDFLREWEHLVTSFGINPNTI